MGRDCWHDAVTAPRLTLPEKAERLVVRGLATVPPRVLEKVVVRRAVNRDGERLAPEIALALGALNRLPGSDFSTQPLDRARHQIEAEAAVFGASYPPFHLEEDLELPGPAGPVPATRYRFRAGKPAGLVVYFHGGGWVLGSRHSTVSPVRFLAQHTGCDVLSVDYRLAPEHPFPAALEDARAAWDFAVAQAPGWGIDPARIAVAGDSAGGNISAVLSLDLRTEDVQPCFQLLFFPVTDLSRKSASYAEFRDGFFLTEAQMDWYAERYLPSPTAATDPRVSPLLAPDLAGAPPAYVAVAGFDPLRDEGIAYAERLREAGVPVELAREGDLIHAFINITAVSRSAYDATRRAAVALRRGIVGPE
ncbi:alpha/beta hydrolase [Nocardioides zeae]|uniref:Alpha/beta hydrolase n=1 Tax=Nocardioides zeae TaxID=1457234 RepID=A0A6P0HK97_9ACTN|nr:alpha/beta hydrolase [Nocardioides zeae]